MEKTEKENSLAAISVAQNLLAQRAKNQPGCRLYTLTHEDFGVIVTSLLATADRGLPFPIDVSEQRAFLDSARATVPYGPQIKDHKAVWGNYWTEHSDHKPNPSAARRAGMIVMDYWGGGEVNSLTTGKQRDFIRALHVDVNYLYSPAYIQRIMAIWQAALRLAVNDGLLDCAPNLITGIGNICEILNVPNPEPDNWQPTIAQIQSFIRTAKAMSLDCMADLCLASVAFGARPEAMRELEYGQITVTKPRWVDFNRPGRRQTKKHRPHLPVPLNVGPTLLRWARYGQPPRRTAELWNVVRMKAGLPKEFRPKCLRHFMATWLRKEDVPPEQISLWLGHRTGEITDRYGSKVSTQYTLAIQASEKLVNEILKGTNIV